MKFALSKPAFPGLFACFFTKCGVGPCQRVNISLANRLGKEQTLANVGGDGRVLGFLQRFFIDLAKPEVRSPKNYASCPRPTSLEATESGKGRAMPACWDRIRFFQRY
ncbi:MAG: hypothetical protein LC110_01940 [Burkholderiales bacterium]|nr:hypothetical protein [Burkholderiales bacterium]